ncbi:NAD(P)-dependent oxidoreductase [Streptomyces sp. NRRL S-495]|uniref:NAD(P)-dependent oxidoreductase n=1 Tax=Streptomyces sp. NRRL S-495 TaxID=1609133 RepID=UPI0005F8C808|nr:NAD(P)-dependent oxidoreductase [Streptomyces sp. NRRL S-495]KJY32147.1 phosphogluconate dehydrogenase [Streptomyces sp. NRRL S-495]
MTTVGLLHPGSMGAAIGAQLVRAGARVLWVGEGRSRASRQRADDAGLEDSGSLPALVREAEVIVSLCPPAAAEDLAHQVAGHRYAGIYLDANAITPERMLRIGSALPQAKAVVDGAVVGSPPRAGKTPRLYLAGQAEAVGVLGGLFADTFVDVRSAGSELGQASALKLTYSTFQKTSRVLVAVTYALAEAHGVRAELEDIADLRPGSYLAEPDYIPKTAARAWRWGPELEEAADFLRGADLPDGLPREAARLLERWAAQKDVTLDINQALRRLHDGADD